MQYRCIKPFPLSYDGKTSRLIAAGALVEVPEDLAPGLLFEGWIGPAQEQKPFNPVTETKDAPKKRAGKAHKPDLAATVAGEAPEASSAASGALHEAPQSEPPETAADNAA